MTNAVDKEGPPNLLVDAPNFWFVKLRRPVNRETVRDTAHRRRHHRDGAAGIRKVVMQMKESVPLHQLDQHPSLREIRGLARYCGDPRGARLPRQHQRLE